jgi:acetolactate synthase I/II/III large subunit
MKASDLFVKALENEGVKHIFAVPGEENLDVVESIRNSSIELVLLRHEQGAVFMAATYGRLTGKTGVCMATLGPGATNLVTGAAYAQLGAMPMMMITGQKPIKQSKQGKFQIVDVVEMMKPLTKFTKQIVDGHNIPPLIREAFRLAERERPGAVHLELPEDIAKENCDCPIFDIHEVMRPRADGRVIAKALEMIEKAKKPLLLIGAGANRKDTSNVLEAFVEKTGIPFFNTQMGKGVIDERNPLFMGTAALSDGDYVHRAIERADLIINVGHDIVEKPPFFMHQDGVNVIHINFNPATIDDVYYPQLEVVGDIAVTMEKLTKRLEKQSHWRLDCFYNIKKAIETHVLEGSDDDRFPIFPPRLVNDVRAAMPSDGIIALDNGMYKIWFARNYNAHQRNTVLLDNALATMGAGLPSAMGVKMVYPDRAVMAICGDGGFMMNSHEIEPAVRLNMHLLILLLRDDAYGMIKWKQANMHFQDFGLDFGNPDFVAYANSYGARGHRVEKASDLVPTIEHCLQNKGVHLIEVPVDYNENHTLLGEQLKQRTQGL